MSYLTKNTPIGSLLRYTAKEEGYIVARLMGFLPDIHSSSSANLVCLFINLPSNTVFSWKLGKINIISVPHFGWEVIKGVRPD